MASLLGGTSCSSSVTEPVLWRHIGRELNALPGLRDRLWRKVSFDFLFQFGDQEFLRLIGMRLNPISKFFIGRHNFFHEIAMRVEKLYAACQPGRNNISVFEKNLRLCFALKAR